MSDPVSLPSGQQVQNTGPSVGIGQTFAAQPSARSDAPVAAATASPLTTSEQAQIKAELARPGAKFADVMNSFWSNRAASAPPAGTDGNQPPASGQDQAQNDPLASDGQVTPQQIDQLVREASEGRTNGQALMAVDSLVRPVIGELSKLDTASFNASWDKGVAEVEKTIYGGSIDKFAEGVGTMAAAAVRLTGSKEAGAKLMNDLDASGCLSNPGVHYKLLNMARQLLGTRPSIFKR